MKRLIVNADDFGRTAGINSGIVEAHQRGIVTSATAMVNYERIREAAELARANPRLGVGLHVALSGGAPALPPEDVPSLVGANGQFPSKPEGHHSPDPAELAAEVSAQYDRFLDVFGQPPTHIDSHHHSHRRPDVFAAVCALAERVGLKVRNAGAPMEAQLRSRGLKTTDRFDESFFDDQATLDHLIAILSGLPEGDTELMCHPAHQDSELEASSSYAGQRVRELQVLTSPSALEVVKRENVRLITFAEL